MFTGIVQAVGRVVSTRPSGDGLRLVVDAGSLDVTDIAIGESIAVAGCCLTVVERDRSALSFDVSAETIRCTAGLDGSGAVNLERALRLADRLGGHLMTGHVDGIGIVAAFAEVAGGEQGKTSWRLEVDAPVELARYIAPKGSIAVDGVSLTVNAVHGSRFEVNLIPHTLAVTTLGAAAVNGRVNVEIDLVARYLERLASYAR